MWEHTPRLQDLKYMQSPWEKGKQGSGRAPRSLEKVSDGLHCYIVQVGMLEPP